MQILDRLRKRGKLSALHGLREEVEMAGSGNHMVDAEDEAQDREAREKKRQQREDDWEDTHDCGKGIPCTTLTRRP